MTAIELELPTTDAAVILWAHACVIWILVNYAHRLDPIDRAEARGKRIEGLRRWRVLLLLRAGTAGILVTSLTGIDGAGVALGLLLAGGAYALPEIRLRSMRSSDSMGWQEYRAEWEIVLNLLAVTVSAFVIGSTDEGLTAGLFSVPVGAGHLVLLLLAGAGAVFLVRGGTHIVRGLLEKSDTFPPANGPGRKNELRHGVTIGNIERLLIFSFALVGSHAAIGLVVAAKGVVRAVEWRDRAHVEYFLIGTLASAGLAVAVGIGIRALISSI